MACSNLRSHIEKKVARKRIEQCLRCQAVHHNKDDLNTNIEEQTISADQYEGVEFSAARFIQYNFNMFGIAH